MKKNLLLFLLLLLGLSACGPKNFNYGAASAPVPQLVIQAEGIVKATPDQLQLRLGVVTEGIDAGNAQQSNNQRMAAVMAMLDEIGIAATDMSTGQFQIHPEWSRPPRPTPAQWRRQIVGYRVSNELLISTTRVDLAGKLLSLAQQSGANQVGGLQFGLADATEYRQQAIEKATARAIRKARTMAAAAGVKLGTLLSMSLDSAAAGPRPMMMAEARMASVDAVPVAAGQVDVSVSVTMVFRLEEAAAQVAGSGE